MVTALPGRPPLLNVRSQRGRVGQSVRSGLIRCSAEQQRQVCLTCIIAVSLEVTGKQVSCATKVKAKAVEAPIKGQEVAEPTDQSAANAVRTNFDIPDPKTFTADIIEREKK